MKVLVSGGGTGGHIYPALALIKRIKEIQPETEFLYVGTERGLESTIVPKANIPFQSVKIEGFKRKLNLEGLKYNMNTVRLFLTSIRESKKIIRSFQPDVVIGTGGYVCAPVCYAASKEKVPTIIHEQNSVVGITNKFLAKSVDKICVCFEEVKEQLDKYKDKIVYTGNPRAQEVAGVKASGELKEYGLDPERETVLIFGGSRGAVRINQTVIESFKQLGQKDYQVLFVTGEAHYEELSSEISRTVDLPETIRVAPYINNMPEIFAGVTLVVARSGATTLAELTALGLPSVLIPSPNVTEDHQTKNALSLVNNDAAEMIKEQDLTAETFVKVIDELVTNKERLKNMSKEAKKLGKPYASDEIIQVMLDVIKEKKNG